MAALACVFLSLVYLRACVFVRVWCVVTRSLSLSLSLFHTPHICCRFISFMEFQMFEGLLCSPDAVNQLAFKLFDVGNVGNVSFGKTTSVCVGGGWCHIV